MGREREERECGESEVRESRGERVGDREFRKRVRRESVGRE